MLKLVHNNLAVGLSFAEICHHCLRHNRHSSRSSGCGGWRQECSTSPPHAHDYCPRDREGQSKPPSTKFNSRKTHRPHLQPSILPTSLVVQGFNGPLQHLPAQAARKGQLEKHRYTAIICALSLGLTLHRELRSTSLPFQEAEVEGLSCCSCCRWSLVKFKVKVNR